VEWIEEYFPDSNQKYRLIERLLSELKRAQGKIASAKEEKQQSSLEIHRRFKQQQVDRIEKRRATRDHPYVIPE
jgi:hypothetical protein